MNNKSPDIQTQQRHPDEDDFFIDESLVRLMGILIPKMKLIFFLSFLAALFVGLKLYVFTPRTYVCKAVIAPDIMRDLSTFDLVQLKSVNSDLSQLPFASQLSQLQRLAESTQVKNGILYDNENGLRLSEVFDCEDRRDCMKKLNNIYSVREIRNVGLELSAEHTDEELAEAIIQESVEKTDNFFQKAMQAKAKKSIEEIRQWIHDVTQEIQAVSKAYIEFASNHNITDLESQFSSGISLISKIKGNIVEQESKLAELEQRYGENAAELLPIKGTIQEYRRKLTDLLRGTEEDEVFPALSNYDELRLKIQDYQDQLQMLRNRAELFNKQLAAAQIEAQKQIRTIMILDEPFTEPASKGTIKFSLLTFIGAFFLLCIFFVMKEYWNMLREALYEKTQKATA